MQTHDERAAISVRQCHERLGQHRGGRVPRGDIQAASAGSGYVGKPRPVAIVQDDRFDATASVTVCAFTTDTTDAPLIRLLIEADEVTGIRESSRLMVDKISTIPRSELGERIGRLSDDDMIRLSRALVVFLGLAGT